VADLFHDKRFVLALLLIALIAMGFWAGSRYPALNEKAALGGGLVLEDPLGFDPLLHLDSAASFTQRVGIVTVNWLYTNRQGMTFGVLLAAAVMTLFALMRRVSFEGTFANTLLGVVVGAPLGVCVNCAAPIAQGLHASGARVETALAAMVSSPTLNVVVLTMLFSLFPLYLVVIKLGMTLLFLLVAIPLLARFVFRRDGIAGDDAHRFDTTPPWASPGLLEGETVTSWTEALAWVAREFTQHLWFIVRTTVPLMLLAGFLGALTITVVPWEMITENLPYMGRLTLMASMVALALVGLILPVPMAFDVVVAGALFTAGVPLRYVGVLLFTLGIFSIYSFMIVGRAISWRVSSTVSVILLGLGFVAGLTSQVYGEYDHEQKRRFFIEAFEEWTVTRPPPVDLPPGLAAETILTRLQPDALAWEPVGPTSGADVLVERRAFRPPLATPATDGSLFTRFDGATVGLQRADNLPVAYKFSSPFYRNTPVSSGDVHGDGWPDILLGSDRGLYLFANRRGEYFERQHIDVPALREQYIVAAALVDLDDDGWLDIFGSAYRHETFVIYNRHGQFSADAYRVLPTTGVSVNAVAFGDLDQNGALEIVVGRWSAGVWTPLPPVASRNVVLRREGTGYRSEPLAGAVGETLSLLLSDVNSDGLMDLIVGNDFAPSDTYFLGARDGLRMITRGDGLVPRTTRSTMSVDSADIDNDLRLEVFSAQVTGGTPDGRRRLDMRQPMEACESLSAPTAKARCIDRMAYHQVLAGSLKAGRPARCLEAASPLRRADCIAFHVLQSARHSRGRNTDLCARLPEPWERLRFICEYAQRPPHDPRPWRDPEAIPQIFNTNVLLTWNDDHKMEDHAVAAGVDISGWSWNAKFADVDQDEWQDLYVVNGRFSNENREPNLFFRNRGDGTFAVDPGSGLGSHQVTAAYTYVDVDEDGDLDVIEIAIDGPVWLHRNDRAKGNAIVFAIRDQIGNSFGIGTRVIIHYGERGEHHQVREIKASGGFVSTDDPLAHFGLGAFDSVARVEIWWSTGERSEMAGPFAAGHRYRLTRTRPKPSAATAARTDAHPDSIS